MTKQVVISNFSYCLAQVPDLVRYGSKPRREIKKDPVLLERLQSALRSYEEATNYPVNQTYIGNISPEQLDLTCHDINRFAMELQNPEIMEYTGSGDIAAKKNRKINSMAVMADELDKQQEIFQIIQEIREGNMP